MPVADGEAWGWQTGVCFTVKLPPPEAQLSFGWTGGVEFSRFAWREQDGSTLMQAKPPKTGRPGCLDSGHLESSLCIEGTKSCPRPISAAIRGAARAANFQ